jgi:hypothetical protein
VTLGELPLDTLTITAVIAALIALAAGIHTLLEAARALTDDDDQDRDR